MARHLFTSESVTEGHPDKVCDQISDAVLDAIFEKDPNGRVACETCASTGLIHIMGEITTSCYVDIPKIARQVVLDIGYNSSECGFDGNTCAVITNIEEDHLDFYKDIDDIAHAFARFCALLPENGVCIGNGDDPRVAALLGRQTCRTVSYGLGQDNQWRPLNLRYDETGCAEFDFALADKPVAHTHLRVPGAFNVMHALATMAACVEAGAQPEAVAASLARFAAPHRRFEYTGTVCGVKLYTDYGHNPAEMRSALENAVKQPHKRLFAVMQPHTYSRVKTLFQDYIHCCDLADDVLVTDIFAAREKDPGDIHATMLVEAMQKEGVPAHYTPTFDDAEAYLRAHWQPGDLVITMSCGNINLLNDQLQKHGEEG